MGIHDLKRATGASGVLMLCYKSLWKPAKFIIQAPMLHESYSELVLPACLIRRSFKLCQFGDYTSNTILL